MSVLEPGVVWLIPIVVVAAAALEAIRPQKNVDPAAVEAEPGRTAHPSKEQTP